MEIGQDDRFSIGSCRDFSTPDRANWKKMLKIIFILVQKVWNLLDMPFH